MKTATDDEVSGRLKEYLADLRGEMLVITRGGEPAALLVPVPPGGDLESTALAASPRFRRIIERSRAQFTAGQGLAEDEFWQQGGASPAAEGTDETRGR